jgi:hypothetical protein
VQFKEVCADDGAVMTLLREHFRGGDSIMEIVRVFTTKDVPTAGLEGESLAQAEEANKRREQLRDSVSAFGALQVTCAVIGHSFKRA